MATLRRATLAPALALLFSAFASEAQADPPDAAARARSRYDEGTQAFRDGRFVEAALEFESAAVEKTNAIALYTAALSWERANAPERAADDYARAIDLGQLPPDSADAAVSRLKSLEALLGTLRVTAPEHWRVQLDANTETATPALLHGAAGVHTLTVRSPAATIVRVTVIVQSGAVKALRLPLASYAEEGVDDSHAKEPRSSQKFWAIGAAAVGAVGLGVGVAFALAALSNQSEAEKVCPNNPCKSVEGSAKWGDAALSGDIATGGFVAGGVGLAGAALLWFTAPGSGESTPRVALGIGTLRIRGSF